MDSDDSPPANEAALMAAYRNARYRIDGPRGEFTLRVDQHSAPLTALLQAGGVQCAALLTAFNPGSNRCSQQQNETAQRSLARDLSAAGHRCLQGRNEDLAGEWPVEPSLLALGLTLPGAHAIAARFAQAAFLWSDASGTPRLVKTAATAG